MRAFTPICRAWYEQVKVFFSRLHGHQSKAHLKPGKQAHKNKALWRNSDILHVGQKKKRDLMMKKSHTTESRFPIGVILLFELLIEAIAMIGAVSAGIVPYYFLRQCLGLLDAGERAGLNIASVLYLGCVLFVFFLIISLAIVDFFTARHHFRQGVRLRVLIVLVSFGFLAVLYFLTAPPPGFICL